MYDSEYFRKVIGNNYNANDLYTTYNENNGAKIYSVDTPVSTNTINEVVPTSQLNNVVSTQAYSTNNIESTIPTQSYSVNNVPEPASTQPMSSQIYNTNTVSQATSAQTYNTNTISEPTAAQTYNENNKIRYPEIYNVLNPMVDTILKEKQNIEYTEATIDTMSTEIYNALEVDVNPQKTSTEVNSTFNNVVAVNSRPKNYLLHDLIKIMLIDKIEKNK